MKDLGRMTVRALRELARKLVGPGYSRLKTKTELISALEKAMGRGKEGKGAKPAAQKPAEAPKPAAAKPAPEKRAPATTPNESGSGKMPATATPTAGPTAAATPAASKEAETKRAAKQKGAPPPEGTGDEHAWERGEGTPSDAAEPRPEGFLVSRVGGESAVQHAPHALTESSLHEPPRTPAPRPPDGTDEQLGDLPWSYGDDSFVALARDPGTLWVYWDFRRQTVDEAVSDLQGARAKLRIFDGNELVRELDLALESHSFYVRDLPAGGHYRAEVVFVGRNGERRVARASNVAGLPRVGPSPILEDRFVTMSWGIPLTRRHELFEKAKVEPQPEFPAAARERLLSGVRPGALPHSEGVPITGREGHPPERPTSTWSGSRYEQGK